MCTYLGNRLIAYTGEIPPDLNIVDPELPVARKKHTQQSAKPNPQVIYFPPQISFTEKMRRKETARLTGAAFNKTEIEPHRLSPQSSSLTAEQEDDDKDWKYGFGWRGRNNFYKNHSGQALKHCF